MACVRRELRAAGRVLPACGFVRGDHNDGAADVCVTRSVTWWG